MREDTQPVNALDLLRSQHEEVEELISEIEACSDSDEKSELFDTLADRIAAHAAIEEKLFYPAMVAKHTRELLVELTEEHLVVKRVVADLLELDPNDEHFDAKLSVLKEQIRHHAHDEEEDQLFPEIEEMMSADELDALGAEMLAMYENLLEDHPRDHVPEETQHAAPL